LPLAIGDEGEVRITLLAVLSNSESVVEVVLLEEFLWVVVAVDVDLGEGVVDSLLLVTRGKSCLKEWQEKLQPVAALYLRNQLVNRNYRRINGRKKVFDNALVTVDIKKASDDSGGARGVNPLDIHFDGLVLLVLVEVKHKVMNEVESVADNDERQLFCQPSFLEEVLDLLGIVVVALTTDSLNLGDLTHGSGGFNILEVHLGVL
jgi:hypothetical protein